MTLQKGAENVENSEDCPTLKKDDLLWEISDDDATAEEIAYNEELLSNETPAIEVVTGEEIDQDPDL